MQKTYNYNSAKVRTKIKTAFRKSKRENTVADIIYQTTLPAVQVEEQIKEISSIYKGGMKVTSSGEILYSFPKGFHQNKTQQFFSKVRKKITKAALLFFKAWTAVMLIGYAVLFTLILIGAVVAAIALSMAGNKGSSNRSSGKASGAMLGHILGLLVRIWFWKSITSSSYGRYNRNPYQRERKKKKPGKPLYVTVFSFLFGDKEEINDWQKAEEKELMRLIKKRKGIITVEEVMTLTGKTKGEADQLLHKFCVYYNGEPKVSENGSIYYSYSDLLRTADKTVNEEALPALQPMKIFSKNKSGTGIKLGLVNTFNIAFSSYFIYFSLISVPLLESFDPRIPGVGGTFIYNFLRFNPYLSIPNSVIAIVLGIIPITYSILFFIVPALRKTWLKKENRRRSIRNLKKQTYSTVLTNPLQVVENEIEPVRGSIIPPNWKKVRTEALGTISDADDIDITGEENSYTYSYPELDRKMKDIKNVRTNTKIEDIGEVIFTAE